MQRAIYSSSYGSIIIFIYHLLTDRVKLCEAKVSIGASLANGHRVAEVHLDFVFSLQDVPHYQTHTLALKDKMWSTYTVLHGLIDLHGAGRGYVLRQDKISNILNIEWIYDDVLLFLEQEDGHVISHNKNSVLRFFHRHPD